jgi:DNA primase
MLRGLELLPKPEQKKRAGLKLPKGLGLLKTQHRRYLKNRKFNPKELEALWNLQGIGVAARLAWRLFIPITLDGQVVSWSTRSLSDDHEGRYITASPNEEAVDHKSLLYGEDLVRGNAIIIVEGPTDAWRIGPGSVATLGTGYSRAQVKRMTSYAVRAICFDSEPAAQRRAGRLADLLEPFPGETVVVELDAEDPGKASPREVRLLRKAFLD